jgi:hypothetical protein
LRVIVPDWIFFFRLSDSKQEMGKPVVFFEDQFLETMLPLMDRAFRRQYAKKKREQKCAVAKKTPPKGAARSATPASKAVVSMEKLVVIAAGADAGLTRQQSLTAAKLSRQGTQTHKWQFKTDAGQWADYRPDASKEVEKAYGLWRVNPHVDVRSVYSGDWHYMIDFNLNQQQNIQHPSHKIREIRRVAME